ncbi:MAG: twin-arginine translocase TatA/TatE family subunit [Planctomycetota bacterium]
MMFSSLQPVLALGMPGPWEWIVIGILGVIIFGKRLPEVGKSLGKGIVEFKKGLSGVEDEIDDAVQATKKLDDPKPEPTVHVSTSDTKAPSSSS